MSRSVDLEQGSPVVTRLQNDQCVNKNRTVMPSTHGIFLGFGFASDISRILA